MTTSLTSQQIQDLIHYRLEKADEMMEIATLMLKQNWLTSAINRLYYGCFYATLALFLQNGLEVKTHDGVIAMLGLKFIKAGNIDIEMGRHYRRLYNARVTGDYDDFPTFSKEQVEKFLIDSKQYLLTIKTLIQLNSI